MQAQDKYTRYKKLLRRIVKKPMNPMLCPNIFQWNILSISENIIIKISVGIFFNHDSIYRSKNNIYEIN